MNRINFNRCGADKVEHELQVIGFPLVLFLLKYTKKLTTSNKKIQISIKKVLK